MAVQFKRAQPMQAALKVAVYGPQGSGKTFTTLLWAEGLAKKMGKRIAFVDTERGTDFYAQAVKDRKVHPEAFDFDAIYTRSLAEILDAVRGLDPKTYGVIVIDSMSHVWDAAIEAYEGKRTRQDSIPMQAWSRIKRPYRQLVSFLIGSPFHVFILGRQKNAFETGADGEMRKIGVAMRAEGETAYEPHICCRFEAIQNPKDTTRTDYACYVEKDRTGVLAGKRILNPGFRNIEPLLPLLGDVQAPMEDDEARQARDGELLDDQDSKEAAKEAKSLDLFTKFQAGAIAAADMSALGAVVAEARKAKRSLLEEHVNALRLIFESRQKALTRAAVGEM